MLKLRVYLVYTFTSFFWAKVYRIKVQIKAWGFEVYKAGALEGLKVKIVRQINSITTSSVKLWNIYIY